MDRQSLSRARELSRPRALRRDTASNWYRIYNVSASETEIFIYDEIGFFGVSADDFVQSLRDVTTPAIRLRINSPGGDVFDGIAIYNAIRTHPASVTSVVDGLAASAASFIAVAGDEVQMHRNSQLMIHDAHGIAIGNAAVMQEMRDLLDMASDNIADIYEQKTGTPAAEWRETMREDKWYSAEDAVAAGLADVVLDKDGKPVVAPDTEEEDEDTDEEELPDDIDVAALLREAFSQKEAAL
jgi:ATP-dependent Clp endopeptidase proteolytic subunit ClpP